MTDFSIQSSGSGSRNAPAGLYCRFFKRGLDILVVLLALPIVFTTLLVVYLLVRSDGGPAFYSQSRVGRGGRVFRMWKFRSMVVDADEVLRQLLVTDPAARAEWDRTQKLRHDPRVTPVGRWIRKLSLDELPQLWNVLAGDMSLVGPRPFLPEQQALYTGREYYALRPGLTGPWQVEERNNASFASRAVYDRHYFETVSLRTDLALLRATVAVVMRGTGL